MATTIFKLKNRYSRDGLQLYQALRESVAKPLATWLVAVFIVANVISIYAELQVEAHAGQSSGSAQFTCDSQYDLQSESTNGRELRSGREGTEHHSTPKLEVKVHRRQIIPDGTLDLPRLQFATDAPLLSSASLAEAPFSPRPPPAFSSLQG